MRGPYRPLGVRVAAAGLRPDPQNLGLATNVTAQGSRAATGLRWENMLTGCFPNSAGIKQLRRAVHR